MAATAGLAAGLRSDDGPAAAGDALALAQFDCCAEGAPLADDAVFVSYSIQLTVEAGSNLEVLDARVAAVDGPVEVEGVFVLGPDIDQVMGTWSDARVEETLDRYRRSELTDLGDCDEAVCQVVLAIAARRVSSEAPGVVRGVEVRYRTDEGDFIESTTFAVGLCLADSTEDCTSPEADA